MTEDFVSTPEIQTLVDRASGLIVPGSGLEHFMDLFLDAKDAEARRTSEGSEGRLSTASHS